MRSLFRVRGSEVSCQVVVVRAETFEAAATCVGGHLVSHLLNIGALFNRIGV